MKSGRLLLWIFVLISIAIPNAVCAEKNNDMLHPVCDGRLWTYIDDNGTEVWPYQWTYCGFFRGAGYALVCNAENEYNILKGNGEYAVEKIPFADEGEAQGYYGGKDTGVIWLFDGEKFAFFDVASGYCSAYCFDAAQDPWFDGECSTLLRVTYDGEHYGYVNRTNGQLQIPCVFQQMNTVGFHHGIAIEYLTDTEQAVIVQETGAICKLAASLALVDSACLEDERLLVIDKASGLYGYCNAEGECIIAPQFEDAAGFSNGFASVCKAGKWGHINTSGALAGEYMFDQAYSFQRERALAVYRGKPVLIDAKGEVVAALDEDYQYFMLPLEEIIAFSDGKYAGLMDTNGNILLPLSKKLMMDLYQSDVPLFSGGIQPVQNVTGKWGYIDLTGSVVIACSYESASPAYGGIIYVKEKEINKVLRTNGEQLWQSVKEAHMADDENIMKQK